MGCWDIMLTMVTSTTKTTKRKALRVHQILQEVYGNPIWRSKKPPLDELISTILSQNTNDINRDRAFKVLKGTFQTWEAVRDAPPQAVIDTIRSAGLANQKGPRIQRILHDITLERGVLDLEFLRDLSLEETRKWLTDFKGVGPKTAAIVMLFSLDKSAFPVDTHVHRVSRRIGLLPEAMTAYDAHAYLESLLPMEAYYAAHLNLIRLGRDVCRARKPNCTSCALNRLCNYYRAQMKV